MLSAREDISIGTKESIAEWGFSVLLVYPSGKTITPTANGRKTSMDISSEGLQIVNNNPYLSIPIDNLEGNEIPDKGCKVKAPVDFFTTKTQKHEEILSLPAPVGCPRAQVIALKTQISYAKSTYKSRT